MKKFGAVLLAIMMVALSAVAFAENTTINNGSTSEAPTLGTDTNKGEAGTWTTKDTEIVQAKNINIVKEITAYNPNSTTVNAPVITYTYTVTPATDIDGLTVKDETTDHLSGTAVEAPVKAGITTGLVVTGTAAGTAGTETSATGTLVFTNTNTWNTAAAGTINSYNINLNFAGVRFQTPGVYRYKIEEAVSPTYAKAAMEDGSYDTLYLDVYVDGTLNIYGYVCMKTNASVTSSTEKTNGFVKSSSGDDKYYTYNLVLSKDVVNDDYAESNHAFPFTVIFNNPESYSSTFTIGETAGTGSTGITPAAASAPTWSGVAKVKEGGNITYTGIPAGVDVDVYETNDMTGVTYKVETVVNNGTANTDNNVSWGTAPTSAVAQTTKAAYESTKATVDTGKIAVVSAVQTVAITNTLLLISPTGVVLRIAPYIMILGAGIILLLISRRFRKSPAAKD